MALQHLSPIPPSLVLVCGHSPQTTRMHAHLHTGQLGPLPIILDVLYGDAAIKRWATPTTIDLSHKWSGAYYKQENVQTKAAHTAKQVAKHLQRVQKRARRKHEKIPKSTHLTYIFYIFQVYQGAAVTVVFVGANFATLRAKSGEWLKGISS